MMRLIFIFLFGWMLIALPASATTILALGDSLTAGYGLEPGHAMPDVLQAALKKDGKDITIINAGVSGDTAAQGAARLDWALTDDVKAIILELGANDALRGLPPEQVDVALRSVMDKAKAKNLPVLILGMKAPPNLGADYQTKFDAIYPKLASDYGALLYRFYLDGVAAQADLNQQDGIHPNDKGVALIVPKLLPLVEQLVAKLP
ncbi:arylesterase [Aestuariivirga litoralis]|uniref:arylesterase n=1 Tax=Aestuariivirga litoralis TaxID=2650924 RepID=UPI0018C81341|nr:arylesterase [Aestuariivirga litoralis]